MTDSTGRSVDENAIPRLPVFSFDANDAERKHITVLFADAVNYTSLSDAMDAEEVHQVIGTCFQMLYDIVRRSDGTVTAFSGDGMMAIFGAPVAREDHAQRACFAALAMQEAMAGYTADVRARQGWDFSIRIGISSGSAIVGTMGHGYTALGDTVNVGARLQSIARPETAVASGNTYRWSMATSSSKPSARER